MLRFLYLPLLLLSVGLASPSFGQAYHPFPHGTTLYSFAQSGSVSTWLFATAVDSVTTVASDSVFHLYRITRPPIEEIAVTCYGHTLDSLGESFLLDRDHYLGRQIRIEPNGDCHFEFSNGQAFLLRARASVGATWTWAAGVSATVDSVVFASVLGQADSIKYISLSSGQTVAISRTFGLVQIHNLSPFVGYDNSLHDVIFQIWGIPALGLGGHLPGYEEMFQFNPGDKFQYGGGYSDHGGTRRYTIRNVRIMSQTPGSKFAYQDSVEEIRFIFNFPGYDTLYFPSQASTLYFDSISFGFIELLPYQSSLHPYMRQLGIRLLTGSTRVQKDFIQVDDFDSCAQAFIMHAKLTVNRFTEGLGLTYTLRDDPGLLSFDTLSCYEILQESWGNCVDINSLLSGITPPLEGQVQLFPNPAKDHAEMIVPPTISMRIGRVDLFSIEGKLMRSQSTTVGGSTLIDLHGLPPGMVFLRVSIPGKPPFSLRLIVLE